MNTVLPLTKTRLPLLLQEHQKACGSLQQQTLALPAGRSTERLAALLEETQRLYGALRALEHEVDAVIGQSPGLVHMRAGWFGFLCQGLRRRIEAGAYLSSARDNPGRTPRLMGLALCAIHMKKSAELLGRVLEEIEGGAAHGR